MERLTRWCRPGGHRRDAGGFLGNFRGLGIKPAGLVQIMCGTAGIALAAGKCGRQQPAERIARDQFQCLIEIDARGGQIVQRHGRARTIEIGLAAHRIGHDRQGDRAIKIGTGLGGIVARQRGIGRLHPQARGTAVALGLRQRGGLRKGDLGRCPALLRDIG